MSSSILNGRFESRILMCISAVFLNYGNRYQVMIVTIDRKHVIQAFTHLAKLHISPMSTKFYLQYRISLSIIVFILDHFVSFVIKHSYFSML